MAIKKIQTEITRDISLIDLNTWHRGYGVGMEKWFGWSFSDSLFYVHNGFAEIMWPTEELLVDFRDYVFNKINADSTWLSREGEKFGALVEEIYQFFDKSLAEIKNKISRKELAKIYQNYVNYIDRAKGDFFMMIRIPMWVENDEAKKTKYQKEIEVAINYRQKSEKIFPRGAELTDLILARVQRETGIDNKLTRVISASELLDYLMSNKKFNQADLEKRLAGFVYSKKGIILTDNSPEDLKKIIAGLGYELILKKQTELKEVRGQVACAGIARGKVRIVLSKKDIGLLQEGEVLVAAMTTQEYLPAMKKSCACVTDEGGITCHAAIVARELKKSCIIGTKIATKVLHDGDLVEVDADKGIVKIISKK